ncbi:chromate transporter [Eubacterium uniforme]|uniref:Chromate transporter n=1 Tax=Eubacterium uniforme TaxID=39495 RepID=A0A1T4VH67_9FIRM|nr:chromate transporter [Eubacterium uniforme]SKA64253.1 chromate transporter [Eubacterium uniforme]
MKYIELLIGFLKVGLFSFGGGYVSIALIRDIVISYEWIDEEKISYMIAVSESTPGPIMVNLATYIGSSKGGILGAFIATTAVVLPAFLIILTIMLLFKRLLKNKLFQSVLGALKPCIIGIILATGIYMIWKNFNISSETETDVPAIVLTIVLGGLYFGLRKFKKKISPIMLICISAVCGTIVYGAM